MRKTTFSLLCSLIYFGMAVFAIKQVHPDGPSSFFFAQFLTACAIADVFGIAVLARPKVANRGLLAPAFLPFLAKTMRFLAGALTLPRIAFWIAGEVLLHPSGELPHWTKSIITFSKLKQQLEGACAASEYIGRAAYSAAHVGETFERDDQLQLAYEYYSCYTELLKARWPNHRERGGAAVLGRILDKMGRYREADEQYEIAERELFHKKDQTYKFVSDARLLRMLQGVSKKSPLHRYVSNLAINERTTALTIGSMFTPIDLRPIVLDWREPSDMSAGVAYSGAHMRDLLSKIKMRNVPEPERLQMHTVDEFDFGKPAFPDTYLAPRTFQNDLSRCHVIMPTKIYARLKELSEME